ncbi:hypothetical protein [Maricaulis sp.]|uniref:hypothetical protein n=1 Tax=Maricaulis sp. TaxID=1486257 RepID=UPI003A8F9A30
MPRVNLIPDNLDARNAEFEQAALAEPVFLNSVPKSGTHLLRNILRMFVPVAQQYHAAFIQYPILAQHAAAMDPAEPRLSWGHLLFSDVSAIAVYKARHILLLRDPYDWVLARARFFASDSFQGRVDHLKGQVVTPEDMLNMAIFGIPGKMPALQEIYTHNAAAWLGTAVNLVRFEDIKLHLEDLNSRAAERFFTGLLGMCGIDPLPGDWRARVLIGADRKQSGTARENLAGEGMEFPAELPDTQKALVDYAAPGLRQLLGYA